MKFVLTLWFIAFQLFTSHAQQPGLEYYLPKATYNPQITRPKDFLGFEVGEQHVSHDLLVQYMKLLATQSNRFKLVEYARSFEHRPLIVLITTSPSNHAKLEALKSEHHDWAMGVGTTNNPDQVPLVLYQGYSIHGNEASGSNASLAVAYYLAAAQGDFIDHYLNKTIILFDPCYNPDGVQRFSTWVNAHKSKTSVTDPGTREFGEPWPGGRTNHYWFDLNRDWMPQQLPESRGRVKLFQEWKPNILTDHHEQGSNSSFFFMPGEPTRVNPNTPKINQELTKQISKYHAEALNGIGSLYYTREGYDDFYYGKGSTYPDVNGGVGILFEQASSRGHAQQTANGILTFPFTIRNQAMTSYSTHKASLELRTNLLNFQRDYYKSAEARAAQDPIKGYVLDAPHDPTRLNQFIDILLANKIKAYRLKEHKPGFNKEQSIVIPCQQSQYGLLKGMVELSTKFEDSLFYDISAWSYPLAFNLQYQELKENDNVARLLGEEIKSTPNYVPNPSDKSQYGYLIDGRGYYVFKAMNKLLQAGLRLRLLHKELEIPIKNDLTTFSRGSILLPVENQPLNTEAIYELVQEINKENRVFPLHTGYAHTGIDIGSPSSSPLVLPKACMLVGTGVDYNDAGEVWHLMDQRMNIPLGLVDINQFAQFELDQYNALILVDGVYNGLSASAITKLKNWLSAGGHIIAMGRSIQWLHSQGMAEVTLKTITNTAESPNQVRAYANVNADAGAELISGAIFETKMDQTHPLAFGFWNSTLPFFKSNRLFMDSPKNNYAAPFRYTDKPLMSGYTTKANQDLIKNSAAVITSTLGTGKVVCIPDNPNFRAFWYGTNRLFLNALFFAPILQPATLQRVVPKD